MASIFQPTYTRTENGKKVKKKLKKWYIEYVDSDGKPKRVAGYKDKVATRQKAAQLERDAARKAVGLIGPHDEQAKRPLTDHLDDWERFLAAKDNEPGYVSHTLSQARTVVAACKWERVGDMQASAVVEFVADLRQPRPFALPGPECESFNAKEVAAIMGVKIESVHRIVKRGQLACDGRGRKKAFSRADVVALLTKRHQGIGVKTSNDYVNAVKRFARWLVRDQRAPFSALESLTTQNVEVDVRRRRRPLARDEFVAFVTASRRGKPYRGLTGADRAALYTLAANSGLRASELGSLTPASFTLGGVPPTLTVAAAYSKHREEDVQPLRPDVADLMRQYLADRPAEKLVWPGTWTVAAAEMVRLDLDAAGVPYEVAGEVFDFHALRHQFITNLVDAEVYPKDAQVLARHKTFALTMDRYAHKKAQDAAGALTRLPPLPGTVAAAPTSATVPETAPATDKV